MALRALVLRKKLERSKKEIDELREKDQDFLKREKELEDAIEEMGDDTTEEDRKTVEEEVEEFQEEKGEHEKKKTELERAIEELEADIEEEEKRSALVTEKPKENNRRDGGNEMSVRTKFFGMNMQERNDMFAREDVKGFLENVRSCMKEKRALTNIGLTIPDIMLPLLKQVAEENSKLVKYVTVRPIGGTSRQNIMGEIPEAYWDEMCAGLKEMDLAFYNMEMDGFKVSGYFAVCNAIIEDSDVSLASELINAIGKAIGKALDKSILYGTNVKMPMGIVTSLLLSTAPADYPKTGREWVNLSKTHVITGKAVEGVKLFQDIVVNSGVIDNDYDTGDIVWIMNKTTHTKLVSESMGVNSAAAIAAGMNNTMPVIGGKIEELKYIPDDTIIFGYFKNYTLVERAGTQIGQSEHVRFLEDQTVFKGTARYDGDLTIREAFAIYGVGKAPDTKPPKFAGEAEETVGE